MAPAPARPALARRRARRRFPNEEPGKLLVAAKAGNIDALKAQFGPTAASCKACHDSFRNQ